MGETTQPQVAGPRAADPSTSQVGSNSSSSPIIPDWSVGRAFADRLNKLRELQLVVGWLSNEALAADDPKSRPIFAAFATRARKQATKLVNEILEYLCRVEKVSHEVAALDAMMVADPNLDKGQVGELVCVHCHNPIGMEAHLGAGDGTGQQFVHQRCFGQWVKSKVATT